MLENIANFITSLIGSGVVIWTIATVIKGYEQESIENKRSNSR